MKILYLSVMFEDDMLSSVFDRGKTPHQAANKYHQLMCRGIAENGVSVEAYSTLPISGALSSKRFVRITAKKQGLLSKSYIPAVNIPVFKNITVCLCSFCKALFSSRDTVIVYDVLNISSSLGALAAAKLRGLKSIGIVTDLPQFMHGENSAAANVNGRGMKSADGYVLLTQEMNSVVNPDGKPFAVLEGHVDHEMAEMVHKPHSGKKTVVYAGALHEKYGVKTMIESFVSIAKQGEDLHIYGDGDYAAELQKTFAENNNVFFHGSRPNDEVVEAELEASLLINPRTSQGEYTKYSFPSKNLEYMVSGTPVLMAKLPGVPREYDGYVCYFDENDNDGLANAMRYMLDLPRDRLCEMGASAREFVLKNKNNVVQAKKLIDLAEQLSEL